MIKIIYVNTANQGIEDQGIPCILLSDHEQAMKEKEERIADLEHDANEFPTMAEFSNMQDDFEEAKRQIAALQLYKDATLGKESERERQVIALTADYRDAIDALVMLTAENERLRRGEPVNKQSCASFEASQRLVNAGIALNTEHEWQSADEKKWRLSLKGFNCLPCICIPAPSMDEVWRELPEEKTYHEEGIIFYEHAVLTLEKKKGYSRAGYPAEHCGFKMFNNTSPTDVLIDLLIWLTEQKRKEKT